MSFDPCVLKVKSALKEKNDERFEIMRLLTEPKDSKDKKDLSKLQKMWATVKKHHPEIKSPVPEDKWVYNFLGAVFFSSKKLAPYFYMNKTTMDLLLDDIRKTSRHLRYLFNDNGLDAHLIKHGETQVSNFFHGNNGFYIYEDFSVEDDPHFEDWSHPAGTEVIDQSECSGIALSRIIDLFAQWAEKEILTVSEIGKNGKNVKAARFARTLVRKNKMLFHQPLNEVVATAAWAIYGVEYSDADVSNLVNRQS